MKKIWNIFINDLNSIRKNWVATIIIIGLIVLPSLYAWFNITASWDPYSQTDQIPVGVVNEDLGAEVHDQSIHVGDDLISSLEENDSFAWHFTDYDAAMDKIDYGDFYAVLVIPSDFSRHLGTVIENKPEKATVEYFVNEKINAIAPKITEKGASVIVEQISSNFISTVNGVIFDLFNELGLKIEQELPDIQQVAQYVFDIEQKLPEAYDTMNDSLVDANQALSIVQKAQENLPKITTLTNQSLRTIDELDTTLENTSNKIQEISPTLVKEMDKITDLINKTNNFVDVFSEEKLEFDFSAEIKDIDDSVNQAVDAITTVDNMLNRVKDLTEDVDQYEDITEIQADLITLKTNLKNLNDPLHSLESFLDNYEEKFTKHSKKIQDIANDMLDESEQLKDYYKNTIKPFALENIKDIQELLTNTKKKIIDIEEMIPDIEQMLSRTETTLIDGEGLINRGIKEYPFINEKISSLADRIREVKAEADIYEIIELLKNDPKAEETFFAEPVLLKENRVYPIQNYGTGMTPFYTVLALWVGVVLLVSLLSVDLHDRANYSPRHIYFGRLMTFLTIVILQTLIVTIGDITLIGVHTSSPLLFILFGLIISVVFTTIIYSVVSVFGDVGKAIAIIMLVLQIASSGGTYPVVLLPEFFQFINPILPFTYAIDLMREAVGGIIWIKVFQNIIILFGMSLLFIGFSIFAKEPFNKRSEKLKEKSKETGLFQ